MPKFIPFKAQKQSEETITQSFKKILEDKKAIEECIKTGGNLKELALKRGIKLAHPI